MKKTFNISSYLKPTQPVSSQSNLNSTDYMKYSPAKERQPDWYVRRQLKYEPDFQQFHQEKQQNFTQKSPNLNGYRPVSPKVNNKNLKLNVSTVNWRDFEQKLQKSRQTSSNSPLNSAKNKTAKDYQRQMTQTIIKLKDIKQNIEKEIQCLQKMLDQTSRHIDHIDQQFQRIKMTILEYTAQSLDAAFVKYKSNMTRWSRYEDVERKGLQVIVEMDKYLEKEQQILGRMGLERQGETWEQHMKQMTNRVVHYDYMNQQVAKVRQQCLLRHPTLKQTKLEQFQNALQELAQF